MKPFLRILWPALLALALGCAAPAAPTATPAALGTETAQACCVGRRCEVGGVALTVRSTSTAPAASGAPTPQAGRQLLVADVTIEVTGDEAMSYAPQFFRVDAADGATYPAIAILPDESGRPGPGEVALLQVVFEVPEGVEGLALFYAPPELAPQEVSIDLTC